MLDFLTRLKAAAAPASRKSRAQLFYRPLSPTDEDLILDLGGGRGRHFARYFPNLRNVQIADCNPDPLAYAARVYGFKTRLVDATGQIPVADGEFDIVFCSSVIEHVTGPQPEALRAFKEDGRAFREAAWRYQMQFASEIRRIGKRYFVQTPYRYFPIETHSWIPMLGYLPTHVQWRIVRVFNRFWPRKQEDPDWALLSYKDMKALFPDAEIYRERFLLFTKSLIAISTHTILLVCAAFQPLYAA